MSKEKLTGFINEAKTLLNRPIGSDDSNFKIWKTAVKIYLSKQYGTDSIQFKEFNKLYFAPLVTTYYTADSEYQKCYNRDLMVAIGILNELLSDCDIETAHNSCDDKNNNVFIVHGHDEELKYNVSNCIRKLGLEPVILHEQINSSDTIIEKLEKYGSEAEAAIILFTPDDFGQAKNEENNKQRARQNVVFEAGFFIGLLGRNKTMLIVSDKNIELPGDLQGIVYSDKKSIELEIARELKNMGFDVDLNKLF